jgi:hypothetical protein
MEGGKPWPNGNFSRRHKTGAAHAAAVQNRLSQEQAQLEAQAQREAEAAQRTPQEQIKRLDALLGKGQGAKRERARLAVKIEAAKLEAKQEAHKEADKVKAKAKPKKAPRKSKKG